MALSDSSDSDSREYLESRLTVLRDVLEDLRSLERSPPLTPDDHKRCSCSVEMEVLKEQVAFLAQTVLSLNLSQEVLKTKYFTLLKNSGTSTLELKSSGSSGILHEGITKEARRKHDDRVEDGELEPHGEPVIMENNDDSGCISDSIESSSVYEDNQQDLPRSNSPTGSPEYARSISSSSSRTLAAPSCPPHSSSGALLDELIYSETKYLNLLQQYRAQDTPEPHKHIQGVQTVDKLYLRHAIFIQTLRKLREQRSVGALICPEQIMINLIRFWSQRDVMDLYCLAMTTDDTSGLHGQNRSPPKSLFSRTPKAPELDEIARGHVTFLSNYLKGVRDSVLWNDVHLECVLLTFLQILRSRDLKTLTETPADVSNRRADEDEPMKCLTVSARNGCAKAVTREASEEKQQSKCRWSFTEGVAFVTILNKSVATEDPLALVLEKEEICLRKSVLR